MHSFVGNYEKNKEDYDTLAIIRNSYFRHFTQSLCFETNIKTCMSHHGEYHCYAYDFQKFMQITKHISRSRHQNFSLLIAGQEGLDLIKGYQPPKNLTITWTGRTVPSKLKNIHRCYVPDHLLKDSASKKMIDYSTYCVRIPDELTENNVRISGEPCVLENIISIELKKMGSEAKSLA